MTATSSYSGSGLSGWFRRNWRLCLVVLVIALSIGAFIILTLLRKKAELKELKAQLAFMQATAKVAGLEDEKKALAVALGQNSQLAQVLDQKIIEVKREAVSVRTQVEEMTDAQVVDAFRALGY